MSDEIGELAALHAFLQRFDRDRESGAVAQLSDYQALWPAHASAIEREYAELTSTKDATVDGRRIGNYEIVRELGRGGQATVFLARDHRLHRDVALKVLPRAFASVQQELRLQREAMTAARLDDSGICPVYDVGQDGSHAYLAMRYVAGETLAARIDAAKKATENGTDVDPLPWRDVVATFAKLCASLSRAHRIGVVHRDIKPQNIMLGSDGQPVLLDFGLAVDSESEAPLLTRSGDVFGTPAYLAPERLLGHSRGGGPRSDLWALGVCLYEALTFVRPFAAPTLDGLYRAILGVDAVDPRRHAPQLPKDLAAVVSVCLEKTPERRYQSAEDLERDLRAVLAAEPIAARPPGAMRRLRRWHRRHAALATAGWLLLLALGSVIFVQRTMLAEVRAAQNEADSLNTFLLEKLLLAATPDKARGREPTASEIFDAAGKSILESFPQPTRVAGKLHHVLGVAYSHLGQRQKARADLERAFAIRHELLGPDARDTLSSRFELARVLRETDQLESSERELSAILSRQQALFGNDDRDALTTQKEIVAVMRSRGRYAEAETLARKVLESRIRTLPPGDRMIIDAEQVVAGCLVDQGKRAEAEPVYRRVLAERRRIHGDDSVLVEKSLADLATLLHDMAAWDQIEAKWDEAEAVYAEDLALARRIYKNGDPGLATIVNNLGTFLQDRATQVKDAATRTEIHKRAEAMFRESLSLREQSDGPESVRVATVCNNLGMLLASMRRAEEAVPIVERAVAIREKVSG
ncbi:MAG: serine/threonine-protein kinase, partial [Planctomycetota bacterium]